MAQYTPEQINQALQQQNVDIDHYSQMYQGRAESVGPGPESMPSPVEIMSTAEALGFSIPWTSIASFIVCVFLACLSKSLPDAIKGCAGVPSSSS